MKKWTHTKKWTQALVNNLFEFSSNSINNFTFLLKFIAWNQISFGAFVNHLFMITEYIGINLNTGNSCFICSVYENIRIQSIAIDFFTSLFQYNLESSRYYFRRKIQNEGFLKIEIK